MILKELREIKRRGNADFLRVETFLIRTRVDEEDGRETSRKTFRLKRT